MLGSAIPRRWAFSLALVGLVSMMVAAYSAFGVEPVFAQDQSGQGSGPSSGATSLPAEDTLANATVAQGVTMLPDQQRAVSVNLINDNGVVDNTLPDVTYQWQIVSGSGVTIQGSPTGRTVTIQSSSTGSAVLQVTVEQGATTLQTTSFFIRQTTITVEPVPATPVPTVAPTNPGPVPSSIPNSQGVVAPEGTLLVNTNGVQTGSSPETQGLRNDPVIYIERGSVREFYGVSVNGIEPSTLPAMPSGVQRGSGAVDITFYNESGEEQTSFRLVRSAQVCLPAAASDLSAGYQNASIFRYNSVAEQWVRLNTTYNTLTQQLCARTSNFSSFAIGIEQVLPTPTPGGELPVTGGWSPAPGLLIFAGLIGIVLVGGGAATMRRARRYESE